MASHRPTEAADLPGVQEFYLRCRNYSVAGSDDSPPVGFHILNKSAFVVGKEHSILVTSKSGKPYSRVPLPNTAKRELHPPIHA